MGMAMPGEKSKNFGPNAKRLMGRLRPERVLVSLVILLAVSADAYILRRLRRATSLNRSR